MHNQSRIQEIGSVQSFTHKTFKAFMDEKALASGTYEVSSTTLYKLFLAYLSENGYTLVPSSRAFGRAASKCLAYSKKSTGTHYQINQEFKTE